MKKHDDTLITIVTPILGIIMLLFVGNPFTQGYKNPFEKIEDAVKFAAYGGQLEYNQAQFPHSEVTIEVDEQAAE